MKTINSDQFAGLTPLEILALCGGFYECPKDAEGKRLGPLVGYAGNYEPGKQWVGDAYVNFATMERHGPVLEYVADLLNEAIYERDRARFTKCTGFCGAPMGGLALAAQLAQVSAAQYIFPEKKIISLATADSRERSELKFERHEPEPGDSFWIVEDVCNNFSTTADLVALIEKTGASVDGIACFLNRSLKVDRYFEARPGLALPVVSLVRKPFDQFRQDDPFVAADIAAGNVVWKPKKKDEWARLMDAVAQAPKASSS